MYELVQYIIGHSARGECQCGHCIDKGPDREAPKHSVNVHFFWVSAKNDPTQEEFERLVIAHYPDLDRLSGGPSYMELGGVLGDQGVALQFIGLGHLIGTWKAITPATLGIEGDLANKMAGSGMVMAGPHPWQEATT